MSTKVYLATVRIKVEAEADHRSLARDAAASLSVTLRGWDKRGSFDCHRIGPTVALEEDPKSTAAAITLRARIASLTKQDSGIRKRATRALRKR